MKASKVLLVFSMFVASLIGVSSAQASYSRGYVRPSGDGPNMCTGSNCIEQFSSNNSAVINTDLFGVAGAETFSYDVLHFLSNDEITAGQTAFNSVDALLLTSLNLQPGDLLTFVFAGSIPTATDILGQSLFAVLGCASGKTAIYDSSFPANLVTSNCTNYDGTSLITNETTSGSSVTFTIANDIAFPSQFAFSFPERELPMEIEVAAPPVPEPASLSMLAAGLIGLGALRRKRAA